MAFLVCYAAGDTPDWRNKAVYLDQSFYQLIFRRCTTDKGYVVLAEIAGLGYEDEVRVSDSQLLLLEDELEKLEKTPWIWHNQIGEFQAVVRTALNKGSGLDVAGDMHPELKRRHPQEGPPWWKLW